MKRNPLLILLFSSIAIVGCLVVLGVVFLVAVAHIDLTHVHISLPLQIANPGPSDTDMVQLITLNNSGLWPVNDVVITNKSQCQLPANTIASGITERWVIFYTAISGEPAYNGQRHPGQLTVQKVINNIQQSIGGWSVNLYNASTCD